MYGPRPPTLNSHRYIEQCLEHHVMSYAYFGNRFIFMYDNDRTHTVSVVRDYATEVGFSSNG